MNKFTLYSLACHIWHVQPKFRFQFKKESSKKVSYERHDYESVDEKSYLGYITNNDEKIRQ